MTKPQELEGRTLAHFKIVSRLGAGGMGIVYQAVDEKLRRTVALKVLPPELVGDEERRQRFLREARAAAALTHPNIATVYEIEEVEGQILLSMELVEGRTMRERLAAGPLPVERALRIARGIARGLARAHQAGVVHRDLKPDNVMVADDDHVKLLDFGLAKLYEPSNAAAGDETATASGATEEGRILGTPGYMSPEQARGHAVDARSDVFSFGIVLFETLTGEKPFQGKTGMDLMIAISRDPAPPPSSKNPAIAPELDVLVARCLEKEPARRFADGAALVGALEAFLTRSSLSQRVPLPRSSRRRLAIVTAGLIVAGALVAGGLRLRRSASPVTADRPITITDLPRPANVKPAALAEYDAGVERLRGGNWPLAYPHFVRAVELEPQFALARMRLADTSMWYLPPSEVHENYRRATELRPALSERDQLYLDAMEPVLLRDPPEPGEAARRLRAAIEKHPLDAELTTTLALRLSQARAPTEEILAAARRGRDLDPKSSDAWQMEAQTLGRAHRLDEALRALDRCHAEVPASNDCWMENLGIDEARLDCAAVENDARQLVFKSGEGLSYSLLGRSMFGAGRPIEAVRSTLEQSWKRFEEPRRSRNREADQIRLAAHAGDFKGVLTRADGLARAIAGEVDLMLHMTPALALVETYHEIGRDRDAAQVASEFLKNRDGWIVGSLPPAGDVSLLMARVQLRAGTITRAEYERAREAFVSRWRGQSRVTPGELWLAAHAQPAETAEDAIEALAARPKDAELPDPYKVGLMRLGLPTPNVVVGKLDLLAGKIDEALPLLERGTHLCSGFDTPFEVVRLQDWLGQAKEAKGDRTGACAAFQAVVSHWGAARPRSITAEHARARIKALGCGR